MKTAFLYKATITDPRSETPLTELVVYRGVDQARIALASHFRVPVAAVKLKLSRDAIGNPIEVLCQTTAEEDAEQCWGSVDPAGEIRCANKARPGFHTCKIHTSFTAPYPADTPEFREWITEDTPKKPARRSRKRSKPTRVKIRPEIPETATKPAKRRSGRGRPES